MIHTKTKIFLAVISFIIGLSLTGCAPVNNHKRQKHVEHPGVVHKYRIQQIDDGGVNYWVYWYIITSSNNSNSYYYRSTAPLTDYTSVQFTRTETKDLPQDVQEEVTLAEPIGEETLTQETAPDVVEKDAVALDTTEAQNDAMTNEGGPSYGDSSDTDSGVDSSSSDAGSSYSGGDSGGSFDSGGGGGE